MILAQELADPIQIIDLIGDVAGLGALGVFIMLGYRTFQQSSDRARQIDDDTIATLKARLDLADETEVGLRNRLDRMDDRVGELSNQFDQCKTQLMAVQAYLKLNHGIDPEEITGTPI